MNANETITEDDHEFERLYQEDQRRLNSGARNLPCPDCGKENVMTLAEINRGYHCSECTKRTEEGF